MKKKQTYSKTDRILTHQFYRNNHIAFLTAITCNAAIGVLNLIISWFFQQLLDVAAGNKTVFNLSELIFLWILI